MKHLRKSCEIIQQKYAFPFLNFFKNGTVMSIFLLKQSLFSEDTGPENNIETSLERSQSSLESSSLLDSQKIKKIAIEDRWARYLLIPT